MFFVFAAAVVWGISSYALFHVAAPVTDDATLGAILLALIPALLAFMIFASAYGTVLPAAAVRGDATLKAARARGGFFKTLWRLITGNLLGALVIFAISLYALSLLPDNAIIAIVASTLIGVAGMFPILLTAAALSLAYLEAEGGQTARD